MKIDTANERPIYLQIADGVENAIFTGAFQEECQIPSTTEMSASLKINPATVLKGINLLVNENILYKKRGIGMFVCSGARSKIAEKRKENFYNDYIESLVTEAKKLHLTKQDILNLLERGFNNETN